MIAPFLVLLGKECPSTLTRGLVLASVSLFVISSGCARTGNQETAYFTQQGSRYSVELKGTRRLAAHDPVSAVRGDTYEESLTLDLPRIDGDIEGWEIPVPKGKLSYSGRITIKGDKMNVDLYYNDSDVHRLSWNGDYKLIRRS